MTAEPDETAGEASILVVDGRQAGRDLIAAILRRSGFSKVTCIGDDEAALAAIRSGNFDCVLLDSTAGLDGREICRLVRREPALRTLPLLLQSAKSERATVWSAFDSGATDVIHKPFDPRELAARVRVHAATALMSRRLRANQERFAAELAEAAALVKTILPQPERLAEMRRLGVDLQSFIRPCYNVGGDLWGVWALPDGRVGLFFADVSGHGIAAALRAHSLHSMLLPALPFADDPERAMAHLDRVQLSASGGQYRFVAAMYGVLDRRAGEFTYVAAGLRDGFLFRPGAPPARIDFSGLPLGLIEGAERDLRRIAIGEGDRLMIFSDALIESFHHDGHDHDLVEEHIGGWLGERIARSAPDGDVAAQIATDFLALNPDCSDDLLIVSALLTPQENE